MKVRAEKYQGSQALEAMEEFGSPNLFLQRLWWETVEPSPQLIVAFQGERMVAIWPVHSSQAVMGIKRMHSPSLTPYCGPTFKDLPQGLKGDVVRRKAIFAMMGLLGKADFYEFDLPMGFDDPLPLVEKGFQLSPRITYRFDPVVDMEQVDRGMSKSLKRKIKAFESVAEVKEATDLQKHLALCDTTFSVKGLELPYTHDRVRAIWSVCERADRAAILQAFQDDKVIGSILLVCDEKYAYYLMGGVSRDCGVQGIAPALFNAGLRWAQDRGLGFDFEGSMTASVESLFRGFGASRSLYLRANRTSTKYATLRGMKQVLKR